ncbi:MAG TPA: hypothetical protein ENK57_07890, partial [Polyangiaceae bacterium]|nr:hypothetical protein [Polyangiaceae bacterium]
MTFWRAAREIIERHDVTPRLEALRHATARRRRLEVQLAAAEARVPWTDRALFFHTTPDEARAAELERALARSAQHERQARVECAAALAICAETCPPIGVVSRVEAVVAELLGDPAIGRDHSAHRPSADVLDVIASDVLGRWAPGVDLGVMIESLHRLTDAAPRARIGPIAQDDRLGIAPMGAEELFARAAAELAHRGSLRSAREGFRWARRERARLLARLHELEAEVGFLDRLNPFDTPAETAREQQGAALRAQDERVWHAYEATDHAVVLALSQHPMIWLSLACRGASVALRALAPVRESVLGPDGAPQPIPSSYGRGIVLACLAEARRACVAGFGPLVHAIWPLQSSPRVTQAAPGGPYRAAGAPAPELPEFRKGETEDLAFVFSALEGAGLRHEVTMAVTHAMMAGVLETRRERAKERVTWTERLEFWSDSDAERASEAISARLGWHVTAMRFRAASALRLVGGAAVQHPLLRAGWTMVGLSRAIASLTTPSGRTAGPRPCPVLGKATATTKFTVVIESLSDYFGCISSREALVAVLRANLERAGAAPRRTPAATETREQLVAMLAATLEGTEFLTHLKRIEVLRPRIVAARGRAQEADEEVGFWDRVNLFSDTPEERRRDEAEAQ